MTYRRPRGLTLPILLVFAGALVGGCAQTATTVRTEKWQRIASAARVVLMPPDIELSELSAGGVVELKAEWTERAKGHVLAALRAEIDRRNAHLGPYRAPADNPAREHAHNQLLKLHDQVGRAILVHHYGVAKLPNKDGKFDWTLGEGAGVLAEDQAADYALFVFLRDSYASAGRKAAIVGAALLGVAMPGGTQWGFASLVDLKSGDLVWFNRLVDPQGDLREPAPAGEAVKKLLADLPL
ncbi:MAG: hypothetical protein HYU25_13560 [Candidatus Rokubacteria bacterium]|nr:hypothetical protein [Candidatus Rokubacteria bacterium]